MEKYNVMIAILAAINLSGFALMGLDKAKAKLGWWRVSERTLLGLGAAFGSFGVYAGLKIFKHKTKHRSFTLSLPAFMIIQAAALIWLYLKYSRQ